MDFLKRLEEILNEALVKNAPVQIPDNARKWLAEYAWIFALIGLVLGVMAVLPLLAALGIISFVGAALGVGKYIFFGWLALLVLVGYLVVLAIAVPRLRRMEKSGWDLIFYSTLFFFVYDIFWWLQSFGATSFFSLLWNIIGTGVSLYVIFQVRTYFLGSKKNKARVAA
jgi:hypothetical protein